MVGNIYGDGQRGGIFGARIDPRLTEELERRAALRREELARPDFERRSLAARVLAAPSRLFGGLVVDPAVEGITDLVTLAGDVYRGDEPTMAADPQTGEFHTAPRLSERTANAAGTLTLGAGAIPAEANALRMGIKAYHGSPHDFERFDASKIGTGEGAQAYGHGLYFAEHPETAGAYKEMLTAKHNPEDQQMRRFLTGADENAPGEFLPEGTDFGSILGAGEERASISNAELVKRSLANLERVKKGKGPLHAAALQKAQATVDYLKSNPQARFMGAPYQGRMYEVDIAAEPEQFLDWDKPLVEQPKATQDAVLAQTKGWSEPREQILGMDVPALLKHGLSDQKLAEAGIPGIRYLDQGSRTASSGELLDVFKGRGGWHAKIRHDNGGVSTSAQFPDEATARKWAENQLRPKTSNYVIFDDKLISILKKYGLPISAAGLAALHELHPEEAQAAQRK